MTGAIKEYNPDPQEVVDGLTVEHRFYRAVRGELEKRLGKAFWMAIAKDDDGRYRIDFERNDERRIIYIDEFTPREAGDIVKGIIKDETPA